MTLRFLSIFLAVLAGQSDHLNADSCHPLGEPSVSYDKGLLSVPLNYSNSKSPSIELYWERFRATKQPSRGAVLYYPGAPFPISFLMGRTAPINGQIYFPTMTCISGTIVDLAV